MVWMYLSLLNYLPMHRHLGSFRFEANTNKAVTNIHKFLYEIFSSKSTVVLFFFFFGNYRLIFIRNYQTVIWKGCATWPSHQKSWEYHFFILTSIYYCYFFFSLISAIPVCNITILVLSSLKSNKVEYLFMCLFAVCKSSYVKWVSFIF